jgi:regulator of sigma E protease
MQWLGAIVAIGILIIVHEAGHFVVARWCQMRVERFSLGFGPAILKWRRWGTQFQLAPIPFGGFVEIRGMNIAEEVDRDDHHAYPNRPVWQRFATIFAGPATNYLFAIFLAFVMYQTYGVSTKTAWWGVAEVQDGYDAKGKLLPGDRILSIAGETFYYELEGKPDELGLATRIDKAAKAGITGPSHGDKGQPVTFEVLRDGERKAIVVVPTFDAKVEDTQGPRFRVGIRPSIEDERVDVGLLETIGHACWYPVKQTQAILGGLWLIITGKEKGELSGVVGITDQIQQAIQAGWFVALQMLMMLNVYLGLFNLFPLPALDGGRLVFLGYEMVTRRRANPKIEATVHMVGVLVLVVVMVLVTYKDCARLL